MRKNTPPIALSVVALAAILSIFSTPSRANDDIPIKMLRYRNTTTGVHAFTTASEAIQSQSGEFRQETGEHLTSDSPFFYLYRNKFGESIPVYRFQDSAGAMILAANDEERKMLLIRGMQELVEPVYVYRTKVEGASEIYRVRNPKNADVVYTTSEQEKSYYLTHEWIQMSSLGFTQSSSSSGTGILLADTVKLDIADLPLVAHTENNGEIITFSGSSPKIAAIRPNTVLYSEKSQIFPLGLVRRVVSLTTLESGATEVVTQPAKLKDAFRELHIYLDKRHVLFPPNPKKIEGTDTSQKPSPPATGAQTVREQKVSPSGTVSPEFLASIAEPMDQEQYSDYVPVWTNSFSTYFYGDEDDPPSLQLTGVATIGILLEVNFNSGCITCGPDTLIITPEESIDPWQVVATGIAAQSAGYVDLAPLPDLPIDATGIPVTASFDLYLGYTASGEVSATLSGSQYGQLSTVVTYDGGTQLAAQACPNPCPEGFSCGNPSSDGSTCTQTASMTGSLNVDANATVYLEPQVGLLLGAFDSGIGATASAKAQLLAEVQPPNIQLYAELVPGLSVDAEAADVTLASYDLPIQPQDVTMLWSYSPATGTPVISVTPASQAYGSVAVGSSEDLSFTVQNTGTGTLSGSASANPPFTIISAATYSLAAGASKTVTVRFSPTAAQLYYENVTFTGGAGVTTVVTGAGAGTSSVVNLTATPHCENTTTPAILLAWILSGATASSYDLYRNGSLYPAGAGLTGTSFDNYGSNVSAGAQYSYYVLAHLSSGGTIGSTTIYATAPSNCAVPAISVTPASQAYGSVAVGSTQDLGFVVQNTGSGTLSGSASAVAPFTIISGGSYSLSAGATQSLTVRFSPTAAQSYNQNVTFTGGGGATVAVTGAGTSTMGPTAHFTMSGQGYSASDGGTLTLTVAPSGGTQVTFSSSSTQGSAAITNYVWKSNGGQVCTGSPCSTILGLSPGATQLTTTISLTVTDSNGQTSTATGTLVLKVQQAGPTAHFAMSGQGNSASDGGTLTLTASGGSATVTFTSTGTQGSAAITSYVWNKNGVFFCPGSPCTAEFAPSTYTISLVVTDANAQSSTANGTLIVLPGRPTPTVTVAPASYSITTAQALSVTITVIGTPTPTGAVTYLEGGGYASGSATLINGSATINIPPGFLAVGSYSFTAVYSGDSNYHSATGTSSTVTVTEGTATPGTITTVAGNGIGGYSGDNGAANSAELFLPWAVVVDTSGNFYIADSNNQRIRKVSPSGIITTVAGTGTRGFSGDGGPAINAEISGPNSVAMDASGGLYITDGGSRVRKVSPSGIITTVAGNGTQGYSGDNGVATSAELNGPTGLVLDSSGNIYFADANNNRIRMVSPGGIITTVAGDGTQGYSGDNGIATNAELNVPAGLAIDSSGNIYIADTNNGVIRKVSPSGMITTSVGTGTWGFSGDGGPAINAELFYPEGLAVDVSGNLYIADSSNNRIRQVTPGGTITTVAGNGTPTYSGDYGPPISAGLNFPMDVAVDAFDNIYIADINENRIRMVTASAPAPSISGLSPSSAIVGGASFTLVINGKNLTSGATAQWGSTALTTAYVNINQLTAIVPANLIATAGTASVTVTTSGGTSSPATFTIEQQQPQAISFPNPGAQTYGVAPITLTATATSGLPVTYTVTSGSASISGSTLTITGAGPVAVQATQIGNSSYLAATPVSVVITVNQAALTVVANNQALSLGTAIPALTGIITGVVAGDGITASYSTTATAGSLVGMYPITPVLNDPNSKLSNYGVTVGSGALVIFNGSSPMPLWMSSSSRTAGEGGFTLTVSGANFAPNSVVLWNGAVRATTIFNSTQLTAVILAADIATEATNLVTVANSAPNASTSAALPFVVISATPVATISGASISNATDGSGNHALTLTGTDFVSGSTVNWNGTGLVTTYLSPWQISATIPASELAVRPATVTVANPAGGSASFELP